jgi:hypothetical protein
MLDEVVLIEADFGTPLELSNIAVQPDGLPDIKCVARLLYAVKNLFCAVDSQITILNSGLPENVA